MKLILLFLLVFIFLIDAYSQANIDKATREVDRSIRKQVQDKLTYIPKTPKIRIDESVRSSKDVKDEGDKEISPPNVKHKLNDNVNIDSKNGQ